MEDEEIYFGGHSTIYNNVNENKTNGKDIMFTTSIPIRYRLDFKNEKVHITEKYKNLVTGEKGYSHVLLPHNKNYYEFNNHVLMKKDEFNKYEPKVQYYNEISCTTGSKIGARFDLFEDGGHNIKSNVKVDSKSYCGFDKSILTIGNHYLIDKNDYKKHEDCFKTKI